MVFKSVAMILSVVFLSLSAQAMDSAVMQIQKLLMAGKQENAKRLIAQYISGHENVSGYMQIGSLYARLRRWPEAAHYLSIGTSRDPNNALAWYELGIAQHQNGEVDNAVASLRKSVQISSKTPKSIFALGEVLELAGDRFDARNVYLSGATKLGKNAAIHGKLCRLDYEDAFYSDAVRECSLAIKLNSNDVFSWALLAQSQYEQQNRKQAMDILSRELHSHPGAAIAYKVRGLIYFREKSYELAIYDLGKALGLNALDEESAISLARSYYESSRFADALPIYVEACRLNEKYHIELLTKQRDLTNKRKNAMAAAYQESLDKVYQSN